MLKCVSLIRNILCSVREVGGKGAVFTSWGFPRFRVLAKCRDILVLLLTGLLQSQSANIQLWDTGRGHDLPDVSLSSIARLQTHWSKFYARAAAFIGHGLAILCPCFS